MNLQKLIEIRYYYYKNKVIKYKDTNMLILVLSQIKKTIKKSKLLVATRCVVFKILYMKKMVEKLLKAFIS